MLLQRTQDLVETYRSKFLRLTITPADLSGLYEPIHFKASKKQKTVPTDRASDEYYDRIDAILDFVTTIGAKMSEYQLLELNKKLILVEGSYARTPESTGFMRDMTLAKYFLAYAAWRFPEHEHLFFNSMEIRSTLNDFMIDEKERIKYDKLHENFMKLMWPAKITLMIHIAEDKAAQLNNPKIDELINDIKTKKLPKGYRALKKNGNMLTLETGLKKLLSDLDLCLSSHPNKLIRPLAANESDNSRPSPSPSPTYTMHSSISSNISLNSGESIPSADLDKERQSVINGDLFVEDFHEPIRVIPIRKNSM